MNNYTNYVSKFEIEISRIMVPQLGINESFSTSWNAIRSQLYDSQYFGGKLTGNYFLKDIAASIKAKGLSTEDELREAVKTIKQVKWDGRKRITCTSFPLHDRFEKKLANSAELNIMLIELLKDLGYDVKPMVTSTRDHGMLSRFNPSINKLNYVMPLVEIEGKTMLLDATDRYLDPLLVPDYCLNYLGRIVCDEVNDWYNIKPTGKDEQSLMYLLEMDSTGQLSGNLTFKNMGYAARDIRSRYYSFSSEEDFIIDFEKRNSSLTVNNFEFTGLNDTDEPITEKYNVKIDTRGDMIGNMVVFNPMFEERITENPFKLEKRMYPVDFTYPAEKSMIINIKLPDNATIEELPKPSRMIMPDKSITVLYNVAQMGNTIQIVYKLNINSHILTEDKYPYIKQFFTALVDKHNENIIIKLNDESVALR